MNQRKPKRDGFGFLPMPVIDWEKIMLEPYFPDLHAYMGLTGPVTFTGTPEEVIRKIFRYQRGFEGET